ncbi:MAG: hemerythrin family protein [Candidatus Marinimicrobia bacterium]|nr:hemerythrin family protein [Candidatus Neomarinimicrobiota bacterium]
MAVTFVWEERFNVGDEEINRQHQYMFELANQIQLSNLDQAGKNIMRLFNYTREHFRHEEEHMQAIGFPDLKRHIELHNDLISKLSEISLNFIKNDEELYRFKQFIFQWMTEHIMHEDLKYFSFDKEQKK